MIIATKATRDSAYDACMSAKIARQTLLEYQSGESDTHNSASATVAQATVTTRGDAPLLSIGLGVNNPITNSPVTMPGSPVPPPSNWDNAVFMLLVVNVGRTSAKNAIVQYAAQLLPLEDDSPIGTRGIKYDEIQSGITAPSALQPGMTGSALRFLGKDGKPIGVPTHAQLEDIRTGKLYIRVFGKATYGDLFGLSHWQRFCVVFDFYQPDMSLPPGKLRHSNCTTYNQIDKNLIYSIPPPYSPPPTNTKVEEINCVAPKD